MFSSHTLKWFQITSFNCVLTCVIPDLTPSTCMTAASTSNVTNVHQCTPSISNGAYQASATCFSSAFPQTFLCLVLTSQIKYQPRGLSALLRYKFLDVQGHVTYSSVVPASNTRPYMQTQVNISKCLLNEITHCVWNIGAQCVVT